MGWGSGWRKRSRVITKDSEENHLKTCEGKSFICSVSAGIKLHLLLHLGYKMMFQQVWGRVVLWKPSRSSSYIGVCSRNWPAWDHTSCCCFTFPSFSQHPPPTWEKKGRCFSTWGSWWGTQGPRSWKVGTGREGKAIGTMSAMERNQCYNQMPWCTAVTSQTCLGRPLINILLHWLWSNDPNCLLIK